MTSRQKNRRQARRAVHQNKSHNSLSKTLAEITEYVKRQKKSKAVAAVMIEDKMRDAGYLPSINGWRRMGTNERKVWS